VVDDYAHHPTEVWAAINAARARYGGARIIAVHTPHTYSRTLTLLEAYRRSFEEADVVVLGPIEAARERGQAATVSSADVAARITGCEVHLVDGSAEGWSWCSSWRVRATWCWSSPWAASTRSPAASTPRSRSGRRWRSRTRGGARIGAERG